VILGWRILWALAAAGEVAAVDPQPLQTDTPEERKEARLASSRFHQPQDPYRILDVSAYTLDMGEVRIGPWAAQVGVTPWLHLGTRLPLIVTGVANLHAKLHVVRRGPVDIAVFVEGAYAPTPGLLTPVLSQLAFIEGYEDLWTIGAGATVSIRAMEPWTLHFTLHGAHAAADVGVDLAELPDIDVDGTVLNPRLSPFASGQILLVRFATDLRFNRRDALILQGQVSPLVRAGLLGDVEIDGLGPVDLGLAWLDPNAARDSWSATLSWEFHFQNADIRVGAGWSAIPGYWAVQALDVAARFGGPARKADREATLALREHGKAPSGGWLHFRDVADPQVGLDEPDEPPLLDCPKGTSLQGAPPPQGFELACVRQGAAPLRHGPYRSWRAEGTLLTEGAYAEDLKDGMWRAWHPNGVLASEGAYVLGKRHGSWATFHPTGALEQRGSYDLDLQVGDWVFGRPDGTLEQRGAFVEGQREGIWVRYGADGVVETETEYRRGRVIRYVPHRVRVE
jgi:hypothetical protein